MKAKLTIVLELLEPAAVASADDLFKLDPSQIRQVSLRLNPTEGEVQGVEAQADPATTNLRELVQFAQAVQTESTTVELWYHGRSEYFSL